jgi:hypothetical protein
LQKYIARIETRPAPRMIYHYTNDAGLKGIIENGSLWFSDIFDQNDPPELRHGLSMAIDILKARETPARPEIKIFASQFERFNLDDGIKQAAHFFICSFSADSDDLGQWRAYADNGRGYALGFDTAELEAGFCWTKRGRPIAQHSTFHVTYSDRELSELQTKLTNLIDPLISLPRRIRFTSDALRKYMGNLLVLHSMNVIRGIMFFKHEAYRPEAEYRFQQLFRYDRPAPDVKYRHRSYSLVRYREFDWRKLARGSLKRIVIGPAADGAKAEKFAKDCLSAYYPKGVVKIEQSKIPYRG